MVVIRTGHTLFLGMFCLVLTLKPKLLVTHCSLAFCRDPLKIARRMGYAFNGVYNGTEINPRFAEGESKHPESAGHTLGLKLGFKVEGSSLNPKIEQPGTAGHSLGFRV